MGVVGRFAPSPTGPLHMGSLVAALGSWLSARSRGGRWLVRVEDLDRPRVVEGAARDILDTLQRFGLTWDGEVVYQSQRGEAYEAALAGLRRRDLAYDCACSRADLRRAASAPAPGESTNDTDALVYPGTCRAGLPAGGRARAVRFAVPPGLVSFVDAIQDPVTEDVAASVGDFVVRRADGPFAYQLAVVVDDAAQGVTEVVRGADLLDSTARQITLARALGLPVPTYAHLPLVIGPTGEKLGKRDGALPLPVLDAARVAAALRSALAILGLADVEGSTPDRLLAGAVARFDVAAVPRERFTYTDG